MHDEVEQPFAAVTAAMDKAAVRQGCVRLGAKDDDNCGPIRV
jgi:hypothetical protein